MTHRSHRPPPSSPALSGPGRLVGLLVLAGLSGAPARAVATDHVERLSASALVPTPPAEGLTAQLNDLRALAAHVRAAHGADRRAMREDLTYLVSGITNQLGSHSALASDPTKSYVDRIARKHAVPRLLRTTAPINTEFQAQVASIPRGAWRSMEGHLQPVPGTTAPARTAGGFAKAGAPDAWAYPRPAATVRDVVQQTAAEEVLHAVSATRHADAIRDARDGRFLADTYNPAVASNQTGRRDASYVDLDVDRAHERIGGVGESAADTSTPDSEGATTGSSHPATSAGAHVVTVDYARTEVAVRADLLAYQELASQHRDRTPDGVFPGRAPPTDLCLEQHDGPPSDPTYTVCLIGGTVNHFQGLPTGVAELPDWRVDLAGETALLLANVRYSLGCDASTARVNARTCASLGALITDLTPPER